MNNLELIHPDDLQQHMQAQSEKIFDTITRLRSRVAKAPPGRLRTTIRGNKPRYYHITDPKKANGQYIPRGEEALAARLAQKDYDTTLLPLLERQLELVNNFIDEYHPQAPDDAYADLPDCRRQFVTPARLADSEYAKR